MEGPDLADALSYDLTPPACPASSPRVAGLAAQIVAIARDHGVAVRRDQDLAALLSTLEVDCPIPVAAFAAVAEILGHLYRANRELQDVRR
ncbi:MAG TPA: EscU/YscU/HrcU family type III secretion system export apparatus switch protein [Geminicoccaceae bacterium]|nr:EscU/YscU/HrcU family type III secretion system export apparatus switch protein [Geminicoccaceae bacterium]